MTTVTTRYERPGFFTRHLFNRAVRRATRWGLSVWGSRELRVAGRRSGHVRTTVVNLLDHDGARYLVAPRGETEWVRNVRVAGGAELRVGRRVEAATLHELADDVKVDVLRAYLRRWKWEVGQFFQGIGPDATDDELLAIAPGYPVFEVRSSQNHAATWPARVRGPRRRSR
jgi:deazaflavin-dependent oxidoreductase (nitroreductase family)